MWRSQTAMETRFRSGISENNTSGKTWVEFRRPRIGCHRSSHNAGCMASVSVKEAGGGATLGADTGTPWAISLNVEGVLRVSSQDR